MSKVIMIQGTMSNAGKSVVAAGLCRLFKQDGYKVAPFKSQNMALNSFVTSEGLEIGRAQAMQAEAAGIDPQAVMNPILLKPTGDADSQVILMGKPVANMTAAEYYKMKPALVPEIKKAFKSLCQEFDIIVIEGAGSPAEINLKENDIVNMGMARLVNAPVLLVGDIDRGGVFAQLYGTYMLFEDWEKELLAGMVINKFRGDKTLLEPGIDMMREKMDVPFLGVLPYISFNLDDEDSLTKRFEKREPREIDIAAIRLPRISNYTDLDVFEQFSGVSVRYITDKEELGSPDLIVIPGTKNTLEDLRWLKERGLEEAIKEKVAKGTQVVGICGGFQMLGEKISDPLGVEAGGEEPGLGLLPMETILAEEKTTKQVKGVFENLEGTLASLNGTEYVGYEIHMGQTRKTCSKETSAVPPNTGSKDKGEIISLAAGEVFGTYVHGVFDKEGVAGKVLDALASKKNISVNTKGALGRKEYKEKEYDRLADMLRENLDMKKVYDLLREADIDG